MSDKTETSFIGLFAALGGLLFLLFPLGAREHTAVFGGKEGWPALSYTAGIDTGVGKFGYQSLKLASNARSVTDYTDLLLDFEGDLGDRAGNYEAAFSGARRSSRALMGKGAALAQGSGGISVRGKPSALFGSPGAAGSFTIEFWLKPAIAENGETVLSWSSSRIARNYPYYQQISAAISNNRLEWEFFNVFFGSAGPMEKMGLRSSGIIIPDKWAHHSVSFDEETGLLEYAIDGRTEDVRYVTATGREGGEIFQPILGAPAPLELCPAFAGCIDEVRILRRPAGRVDETRYTQGNNGVYCDIYGIDGGRFETLPITASPGATLVSFESLEDAPDETSIQYFVRAGDHLFGWTESDPPWFPVEAGKPLPDLRGRYFQIGASLYPDGAGSISPSVTSVSLTWREEVSPLPPSSVQARAENGAVSLSWSISPDEAVGGYYVYYGERPGEYLGAAAAEGPSPVSAGKETSLRLTGLKNGRMYYFAVAAYSRHDPAVAGEFSREVHARPLP
ncbi:MAG: fibronectin type III domain-containing protein [Spirochaetaceae bacterium]|nr:fibronectin type III domain-containing protein [Spirochaetaceae bacterium]